MLPDLSATYVYCARLVYNNNYMYTWQQRIAACDSLSDTGSSTQALTAGGCALSVMCMYSIKYVCTSCVITPNNLVNWL